MAERVFKTVRSTEATDFCFTSIPTIMKANFLIWTTKETLYF